MKEGYIIKTAFTTSVNEVRNAVYKGVVPDGEKTLNPYSHAITIEVINTRNDTKTRFHSYINYAQTHGYVKYIFNDDEYWLNNDGSSYSYTNKEVAIRTQEPSSYSTDIELFGYSTKFHYAHVSHPDTYLVTVDFSTKAFYRIMAKELK